MSYSTDPDYNLVRNLENFLRTFHRLKLLNGSTIEELLVCVDASSFLLAKDQSHPPAVNEIVAANLARSKRLLVFCSKTAAESKAVEFEVDWFLKQERAGDILLAITEGSDPALDQQTYFSEALQQSQVTGSIWFDFRGFRPEAKSWKKVRDFKLERVRLAAELCHLRVEQLYPEWLAYEQRQARLRLWRNLAFGFLSLVLIAVSVWFLSNSREHQREAEARRLALEAESDAEQKPDSALSKSVRAYDALADFGELPLSAKTAAVRAAILRALAAAATSQPFLVTHLKGEGQGVEALATDGNVLWAGDNAGMAYRWDTAAKPPHLTYSEKVGVGNITAASATAHAALITGTNGAELLIDTPTGISQTSLSIDNAVAAAFSPDGRRFAVGDAAGHIFTGAIGDSRVPNPAADLKASITALWFRSSTQLLASAWNRGPILPYDFPAMRSSAQTFRGIGWAAHSLAPLPGGFVSGHEHGEIAVWSFDRETPVAVARVDESVQSVTALHSGLIASGGADGNIILWMREGGSLREVHRFRAHRGSLLATAELPQGLASSGSDGAVRLWNVNAAGAFETVIARRTETGQDVAITTAGEIVGIGPSAATRWTPGGQASTFGGWKNLEASALSGDGGWLALEPPFADRDGGLYLARISRPDVAQPLRDASGHTWRAEFSRDGEWLAAARMGRSGRLAVWHLGSGSQWNLVWNVAVDAVEGITIDVYSRSIACGGADRTVQIRDLTNGKLRKEIDASRGFQRPNRFAYDPAGARLALGYLDGTVTIVDAVDPAKVIRVCEYHRDYISALQFDPSGKWLASAGSDGKLVLWEALEFQRIIEWSMGDGFARAIRFSADGKRLAITRQGGAGVSVFDVDPASWRRRALAMRGS